MAITEKKVPKMGIDFVKRRIMILMSRNSGIRRRNSIKLKCSFPMAVVISNVDNVTSETY